MPDESNVAPMPETRLGDSSAAESNAATSDAFFHVGGTMAPDTPSYITRPADDELLDALDRRELCLLLAPRQTGKSSMMVRAMQRLEGQGKRTGIIDLQMYGSETDAERWYRSVANQIRAQFQLPLDLADWWQQNAGMSATEIFRVFLEEALLGEIVDSDVVIFVDEIDSALKLPFSDDLFTTIRALYNARATSPDLKRLNLVLAGRVSPNQFIRDKDRTPFNIGTQIDLTDFDAVEMKPFRDVLGADSDSVTERIFYWAGGQPLLTQMLAKFAFELPAARRTVAQIDEHVAQTFLTRQVTQDRHLKYIRDYILDAAGSDVRKTLSTYRDVLERKQVPENRQSPTQTRLKLAGVVKTENGVLVPRNRIYENIFSVPWVVANMPAEDAPETLAQRWFASGQNDELLPQGNALRDTIANLNSQENLPEDLTTFLVALRRVEREQKQAERVTRSERLVNRVAVPLTAIAVAASILAIYNKLQADVQRRAAEVAKRSADENSAKYKAQKEQADRDKKAAVQAKREKNDLLYKSEQINTKLQLEKEAKQQKIAELDEKSRELVREAAKVAASVEKLRESDKKLKAQASRLREKSRELEKTTAVLRQSKISLQKSVKSEQAERRKAESRELAAAAELDRVYNLRNAIMEAKAAYAKSDTREARNALRRCVLPVNAISKTEQRTDTRLAVAALRGDSEIALLTGMPTAPPAGEDWGAEGLLWDAGTGRLVARLIPEARVVEGGVFATGSDLLCLLVARYRKDESPGSFFAADTNRLLRDEAVVELYNAKTGERRRTFTAESEESEAVRGFLKTLRGVFAVSRDGRTLALTSTESFDVTLWDVQTERLLHRLPNILGNAEALQFSPDGRFLAGGIGRTLRIWDVATGEKLSSLNGHDGAITAVAWSPDATRIATASVTGGDVETPLPFALTADPRKRVLVQVWDNWRAEPLKSTHRFTEHEDVVEQLAFGANGRLLLTASADSTARLFDVKIGEEVATLIGAIGTRVLAAGFSRDGKSAITINEEGMVRRYAIPEYGSPAAFLRRADALLNPTASLLPTP